MIGRSRRSGSSRAAGDPRRGWLTADGWTVPVALGRGGILANKREGDGGTPRGHLPSPAIMVARRPPPPAADLPAGPPDPARRRLVRGPERPPLQSADPARPAARPATGSRATITSTTSSSRSITTAPRVSPAAAAPCSCIWRAQIFRPTAGCVSMTKSAMLRLLRRMGPADQNYYWMNLISRIWGSMLDKTSDRGCLAGRCTTIGAPAPSLTRLKPALRPHDRAEGYAIQAALEKYSTDTSVRLEDRSHQRGRTKAHQCRRPDGRTHPGRDRDCRWRHGVDGRQRNARRRAGIRLPHAHAICRRDRRPTPCSRCSMPSTRCIPAIEIPDSRFADFVSAGAAQLIADNACAHLFVLGAGHDCGLARARSGRGKAGHHAARPAISSVTARTCSAIPGSR